MANEQIETTVAPAEDAATSPKSKTPKRKQKDDRGEQVIMNGHTFFIKG